MKPNWRVVLFLLLFSIESILVVCKYRNSEPQVGDAAEVHNIAYNLAHGRGYRFDWNDPNWRALWQAQNVDGRFDFIVVRRGSYPTMSRPPLMPILLAGVIRLFPHHSFLMWRIVDSAAFAAAGCLLCDVAYSGEGCFGLVVMLVLILADHWRRQFVPGWWTEGLAFDFVSVIAWLVTNGKQLRPRRHNLLAGLVIGLLCLDRSVFTILVPFLCMLLGYANSASRVRRVKSALMILGIAVLVQSPWWVRNVEVSGRFLPLGTQGGINLPDEYGDIAVAARGTWTGWGMRDVWSAVQSQTSITLPPGMSAAAISKLSPFDANDHMFQVLIAAMYCTSLQSEISVSDAGTHAAMKWLRANYYRVPWLMIEKGSTLIRPMRVPLGIAMALAAIGLCGGPAERRTVTYMATITGLCIFSVMVTHVVRLRFLIPMLPPVYVMVVVGMGALVRFLRGSTGTKSGMQEC